MNTNEVILSFLIFMAKAGAMFRQIHVMAEKCPGLKNISTQVIPFRVDPSEYADGGVTLSFALDADVVAPDGGLLALGISLVLRRSGGVWIAEAAVGGVDEKVGWTSLDSRDVRGESMEDIIAGALPLIDWMRTRLAEVSGGIPVQARA